MQVSAIVPIYNEEKTLAHVLDILIHHKDIGEIICVDDASTDTTPQILNQHSSRIIQKTLEENKGKGNALAEGLEIAKNDTVLFLDADLEKLSAEHIDQLLSPVLSGEYVVVIGSIGYAAIAGQRVYRRADLLPLLTTMKSSRYGVEILLNNALKKLKTKIVHLENMGHITKFGKRNGVTLWKEYQGEFKDVIGEYIKQKLPNNELSTFLKDLKTVKGVQEVKSAIKKIRDMDVKKFATKLLKYLETNYWADPSDM
jgi:glycosyltransferase involved in cell wall biosynthesis